MSGDAQKPSLSLVSSSTRKLPNFIDGFTQYMADKGSPPLYTKWAGIFAVAAACERKVWVTTLKGKLYPNQYIVLVGPAGIGKSVCTNTVYDLLDSIRGPDVVLHIAPTSVTKASLIDCLDNAQRVIIRSMQDATVRFNSLVIIPNELGVFLPSWEGDFMNTMTDLWDCKRYAETRRTKSIEISIPNTQLNLLSATTPAYLNNLLPEGAWEEGFMSRTMLAYSSEVILGDIFGEVRHNKELWDDLVHDLAAIHKLYGEMTVTDEVIDAINSWNRSGGFPRPDHPKLLGYNMRRATHLLKLMMVAAVATDGDKIITLDHYAEALDWLTELEIYLPDIFKSMRTGGDAAAVEECWHYCYHQYMRKNKEPIPESLVYAFLQERVPVHSVARVLEVMEKMKLLEKAYTKAGTMGYVPKTREPS